MCGGISLNYRTKVAEGRFVFVRVERDLDGTRVSALCVRLLPGNAGPEHGGSQDSRRLWKHSATAMACPEFLKPVLTRDQPVPRLRVPGSYSYCRQGPFQQSGGRCVSQLFTH